MVFVTQSQFLINSFCSGDGHSRFLFHAKEFYAWFLLVFSFQVLTDLLSFSSANADFD